MAALDWVVTADCPECARPVRLVRRRDGGSFVACVDRDDCGFTASRDEAFDALLVELARLEREYLALAQLAVPKILEEQTGLRFSELQDAARDLIAAAAGGDDRW